MPVVHSHLILPSYEGTKSPASTHYFVLDSGS